MGACAGKTVENKICFKCGKPIVRDGEFMHACPLRKPILHVKQELYTPNPDLIALQAKAILETNGKIKVKIPKNNQKTQFIWKYEQSWFLPPELKKAPRQLIKGANFQQKLTWFRMNLEAFRIPWDKGSDVLNVDRWNILFSSLEGLKKVNMLKQLKINFTDEKVDDAGGLLRQWLHLCVKQIMSKQSGLFKQCETDQTAYKFVWDKNIVEQVAVSSISFLGLIIGKALFERISLNCPLNHTILRQICSQPVYLQDCYSYDKALYTSWSQLLKMQNAESLGLDGCIYHTHGDNDLQQIEVIPNGKTTVISNKNRVVYVTEIINLYCTKSVEKYLQALCTAIYSIVPAELLSIFQPRQLETILNGAPEIDVADWKAHTAYEGYKAAESIIMWFWEFVEGQGQEGLRNLLHYCTGAVRVPVFGFGYLESNRGELRPFTIRKVEYAQGNPYPKSHMCFNRLQLPAYTNKQELHRCMKVITSQELNHFGLS